MGVKFLTFYRLCVLLLADVVGPLAWPRVLQQSSEGCFALLAGSRAPRGFLLVLLLLTHLPRHLWPRVLLLLKFIHG